MNNEELLLKLKDVLAKHGFKEEEILEVEEELKQSLETLPNETETDETEVGEDDKEVPNQEVEVEEEEKEEQKEEINQSLTEETETDELEEQPNQNQNELSKNDDEEEKEVNDEQVLDDEVVENKEQEQVNNSNEEMGDGVVDPAKIIENAKQHNPVGEDNNPQLEQLPNEPKQPLLDVNDLQMQLEEERKAKEGLLARLQSLEEALTKAGILENEHNGEVEVENEEGVIVKQQVPYRQHEEESLDKILDFVNKKHY